MTGASGYLGSHIAHALLETGWDVTGLARPHSKVPTQLEGTAIKWLRHSSLSSLKDDSVVKELSECSCIIHCATNYGRTDFDFLEQLEANLFLPLHLLHVANHLGINYFINTDTLLDKRVSTYSRSKSQFAEWIQNRVGNVRAANISIEHFYGPRDDSTKFVSWLLEKLLFESGEINLTKGMQKRDFIFISDAVDAFLAVINNLESLLKNKYYVEIQLGSGQSLPLRHMVEVCTGLCEADYNRLRFGALPYRENELMNIDVDIEQLIDLGWTPKVPLVEGLRITIDSIKQKGTPK